MTEFTPLSVLGEFGWIERLKKRVPLVQPSTLKGIGDDAAVIHPMPSEKILWSTDLLLEGVHFDLRYFPLKHLGYKTVIVGISDILAMNAIPRQLSLGIGISSKFSLEALEELSFGVELACEKYGIDWVGGDTTSTRTGLTLAVSVLGTAPEQKITYRNGAQEYDLIVTTGDLGGAYLGLQVLEREKKIFLENPNIQPDLSNFEYVVERQLKPEARLDIIETLLHKDIQPSSMIDISDGLASDLLQLTKASGVGCRIYEEKLPISSETHQAAENFNLSANTCVLNGGEDYELLFTIKQKDFEKIKDDPRFSVIGHITAQENGTYFVTKNEEQVALQAQGWR